MLAIIIESPTQEPDRRQIVTPENHFFIFHRENISSAGLLVTFVHRSDAHQTPFFS
jgi:hypothetical protein